MAKKFSAGKVPGSQQHTIETPQNISSSINIKGSARYQDLASYGLGASANPQKLILHENSSSFLRPKKGAFNTPSIGTPNKSVDFTQKATFMLPSSNNP